MVLEQEGQAVPQAIIFVSGPRQDSKLPHILNYLLNIKRVCAVELWAGTGSLSWQLKRWLNHETVLFLERKPVAQRVLNQLFPGVPIVDDYRNFDWQAWANSFNEPIVAVVGGPSCKDYSNAGLQTFKSEDLLLSIKIARDLGALFVVLEITPAFLLEDSVHGKWTQLLKMLPHFSYNLAGHLVVNNTQLGGTGYRTRLLIFVEDTFVAGALCPFQWPSHLFKPWQPMLGALDPVMVLQDVKNWASEGDARFISQVPRAQLEGAIIVGKLFWGHGASIQAGSKVFCTNPRHRGTWRVVQVMGGTVRLMLYNEHRRSHRITVQLSSLVRPRPLALANKGCVSQT